MDITKKKEIVNKLYTEFNNHKLFYKDGDKYDKLISPGAYIISKDEFKLIGFRAKQLFDWHETSSKILKEILTTNTFPDLKKRFLADLSKKAQDYQIEISKQAYEPIRFARMDTTNMKLRLHEAQFRWGAPGHYYFINQVYDRLFGNKYFDSFDSNLGDAVQTFIDDHIEDPDRECVLFMNAEKYKIETKEFSKNLHNLIIYSNQELNELNFEIKKEGLIHKESKKLVKAIIRREASLYNLSQTEFGCKLIELTIEKKIFFEPGLNMLNDNKFGIALLFDKRTEKFYDRNIKDLYLKTAFYEPTFESFNHTFSTNYKNLDDFLDKTTAGTRKFVFKYSGNILKKSFGGGEVYRWTTTRNKILSLVDKENQLPLSWILQELDNTKSSAEYGIGDYSNPNSISIKNTDNASTRLSFFVYKKDDDITRVLGMAALVTDEWKSRYKSSNQLKGQGAIVLPTRVEK